MLIPSGSVRARDVREPFATAAFSLLTLHIQWVMGSGTVDFSIVFIFAFSCAIFYALTERRNSERRNAMIDQASNLASFPLTLVKQVTQSTENLLQQTRQEVEEAVESGFRSEERQSLEESTSPSAATQPSQDSNSSGEDRGKDPANTPTDVGSNAGGARGNVVNDVA